MKARARVRSQHGFTLSELLVACAVIAFVMAGLLTMLQSGQESYLRGSRQIEAQQNVRLTMDRVVDELRNAGFCPTCSGDSSLACPGLPGARCQFAAVTNITSTSFTLLNDWNGDWDGSVGIEPSGTVNYVVVNADGTTATTQRGERIIYTVTGGTLTRQEIGVDASAVTLVTGINSLTFTFQDSAGTAATGTTIRQVLISMTAQPSVQAQGTMQGKVLVTMGDTVRLRNRGN